MTFRRFPLFALLFSALLPIGLVAQESVLKPDQPQGITSDQIIQRFAAKEKEFKQVWERYTYRETVKVEEVDGGEFQLVTDITFGNDGKRAQSVVFAPQPTLSRISMSKEDYDLWPYALFLLGQRSRHPISRNLARAPPPRT